ncbi:MAG: ATPase [Flavobacteriales bacterium]|nr:ATPase [Flavobacteriales bacterium]
MTRIVLTGGPGVGKTTLIKALSKKGYSTFNEAARKVIQKQLELNTSNLPWDNVVEFSKLVLIEQIKDFNHKNEALIFYDRGIPDITGYLNHARKNIFRELKKSCSLNRYDYVFILPPWKAIYTSDNERRENFEEAKLIYNEIEQAYLSSGYKPILVPFDSIDNRINFILEKLNE